MIELDLDGTVKFVSSNLERILHVDEDQFRRDAWQFLQPPEDGVEAPWMASLEESKRWIEVNPSRPPDSDTATLLLVVRDVTDRVELADRLSGALRLESLGVMAAGVAHDFNNLLVPIVANAGSILGDLPEESLVRDRVVAIDRAAGMASQLADEILASTGESVALDGSCDVALTIRDMVPVLTTLVPDRVEIEFDLEGRAPARVDNDSVAKLVTNLVINAGQAIEGRGRVDVSVRAAGDRFVLKVSDDGVGMSQETAARITEPFFTTRAAGQGLGLASLAGLVHSSTAQLEVSSSLGVGTAISVSFEAVAASTEEVKRVSNPSWPHSPSSIMLVDDDDLVRQTIHRLAERMFGSVESVSDGRSAVELLSTDAVIDCVVVDLTMPGVRGPEVIEQLRVIRPELPAVVITGAGENAARTELDAAGLFDVAVLTKPFSPHDFFDAVVDQLPIALQA